MSRLDNDLFQETCNRLT